MATQGIGMFNKIGIVLGLAVSVLVVDAIFHLGLLFPTSPIKKGSNEHSAIGGMMILREMSEIFKNEDSDRNGLPDYWVADVSGLYRVLNVAGNEIRKIDTPVALADARPIAPIAHYVGTPLAVTPTPKAGYFFRAMERDENGTPYAKEKMGDGKTVALNRDKFAFCAYPATYLQTGRYTFIVNEKGTVWRKDLSGLPLLQWPDEDPARDEWKKIQ